MMRYALLLIATASLAASPAWADDILDWNATLRSVIQADIPKANPGWSTRAMTMANGAMYDVMQAFNSSHEQFQYHGAAPLGASQPAAVARAAYDTMLDAYPDEKPMLDAALAAKLAGIADGPAKTAGLNFGAQVAQTYTAWRMGDGADQAFSYSPTNPPEPGRWQPDPLHPGQQAWGPGYGMVNTFAISSSTQFAVPGAPAMTSQAYTDAYNEVKDYGELVSASRTPEQTDIARFWAYDRPTMGPPPVLYSRNLDEIAVQMGNTPAQNARLFAMASVSMADAAVAAWDVKFKDDFWRPVTGIRAGDTDGNPNTLAQSDWTPLGAPGDDMNGTADDFTPPFPAYVSGHATFGGATYEILRQFYGSDSLNYQLTSQETQLLNSTRHFTSFSDAEWENAISRVYLGIHWRFDATDGVALGNDIGDYVSTNYFRPVPEPSTLALAALAACGGAAALLQRRRRKLA